MVLICVLGMFKCVVGYVGVYDMVLFYKKGDIYQSELGCNVMCVIMGVDENQFDVNLLVMFVDKIDVLVLLIYGEDDQCVLFVQFKVMKVVFDVVYKLYEFFIKLGEGYGFYSEKNNVEFYNIFQVFLEKYIGKGVQDVIV